MCSPRRANASRYERRRLFLEPLQPREVLAVAVDAFTPTPSGFTAELSAEIRQSALNLYDTQSQALGAADVTLTGSATGNVRGSLVVEGTTLTFVATGGALPADTYTAKLRSAANGIVDQALGELLDGEFNGSFPSGNGTPGGDFNFTFSVTSSPLVVSIPDFARGPEQSVQVPAQGSGVALPAGLPIQLSDANGVTSFTLTVNYDPALLTITSAELGPDAPSGSQVEVNTSVPGQATIAFFSLDPMSSGAVDVVNLIASVPETATYGVAQVVDITFLEVNAGDIQATADDAIHVVAFPGDANANRRYDAEDARLIARTGLGLDSGFVTSTPTGPSTTNLLYPTIDAVIIGDVTGVDGLSPLDASDVLRVVVGLPTPNIPARPTGFTPTALNLSATSVSEDAPTSSVVGTFTTTDPDAGDTHTYTLVTGAGDSDNNRFTISGATLRSAATFDHALQDTLNIRVRTTDSTGRFLEKNFTIMVTDVNEAPTAISLSNNSVPENILIGGVVGNLTSTDPDVSNTFTYSLVAGAGSADNASFSIDGDELKVAAALDFETQSSYSVRVRSTDQGGLFFEQVFTVSTSDVNEAPTALALSNATVIENEPVGTSVGTLTTSDEDSGDTHTYTLVSGAGDTDNASFAIIGNELRAAEIFDFESQSSFSIRVESMDAGGLSVQQVLTISISNLNEAPTAVALGSDMIAEDAAIDSVVGMLSTTDPDNGNSFTYSFVSGNGDTGNGSFTIVGDELRLAASLDFEMQDTYSILVRSVDQGGLSVEQVLTIAVTNVNEAPAEIALSDNTVAEDVVIGSVVGTLSTVDPDSGDTHTYALVSGDGDTGNASFAIVGDELQTAVSLDFESQTAYSVRVQSTDADGLTFETVFTITVTDANDAPTAIAISRATIAESEPIGTLVGLLATTDPDSGDTHTYSLITGDGDDDNGAFSIVGDQLLSGEVFDQATKNEYRVRVQSIDAGGLTFEVPMVITITEANVAPTAVAVSNTSVDENVSVGTLVGTLSTTDANATDTHTYMLVAGPGDTDNAAFAIDGDQLVTAASLDFEMQDTYSIRIESTDSYGLSVQEVLTITVNDVNELPTAVALSSDTIAEDAVVGSVVGTLSTTDPDSGDTHTYTFIEGDGDADNSSFTIVGDELRTAATLDFETQSTYTVRVQSTDAGGLMVEQTLIIDVSDVNENPTGVSISNTSVAEAEAVGTLVGLLSTIDPDSGDTHTYSFVAGEGDTDNASFSIDGDQLLTGEVFDQATKSTYSLRVQSADSGGLMVEEILTISITEANVAPTAISLSNSMVNENSAIGTLVGTLSSTDANSGDTHAYSLVTGTGDTDNASFTITGDQLLTAVDLDFEMQDSYSIRVQSTDRFGLSVEEVLTISVDDLNEAPTALVVSDDTVAEAAVVGSVVGTLSSTDPDSGDTFTYSLVEGVGDTDNTAFTIVGDELQTAITFDFNTQSTYSIRVQSMDQGGLSVEQLLTITVIETNVAPTAVTLDNTSVDENAAIGTLVGTLATTDANSADTHTYQLVAGPGDTDNGSFTVDGNQVLTAAGLDFETQDSYSIRVQSTDSFGLTVEAVIVITVNDVNEAPTEVLLSNDTVSEDAVIGTVVGLLTSSDPDSGNTHTYDLVAGAGSTDNASFTIVGDELRTAVALEFATQSTYSIRVQSVDQDGELFEQILSIFVSEVVN
ncbi:MAG: cadherin domain-containing protein [Planctomycetales bacterium]|nr:cadherin domain-containing protein [Planctomycetales bacterium]